MSFRTPIAEHIWNTKYRLGDEAGPLDGTVLDTWRRVADAVAGVEAASPAVRAAEFFEALKDFKFLPGGRILAGAGSQRRVTLFNCFVMDLKEDSVDAIFEALKEGALTMQAGGGVGYDFSTLRPAGSRTARTGNIASGPVSFMGIWDAMCATLLSTGARRGAMMATLRCDHPDIEQFVDAKQEAGVLTNFNCSVLVTDAFMAAVDADAEWPLMFPAESLDGGDGAIVQRVWPGFGAVPCRVVRTVRAAALWEHIMRSAYATSEPGVLFIDRINTLNNLHYCEHISATNPCGEIPLPGYGACNLGSINLTRFVRAPFSVEARLDLDGIRALVPTCVRFLDDVVEASEFPLPAQAEEARATRRIGLGFTGLADALAMLGLHYADLKARRLAAETMQTIRDVAYETSITLAKEKGPFPRFEPVGYLSAPGLQDLPEATRGDIARFGIRNSHLTAIAPAGTISLFANNVSSGIEPIFQLAYQRRVLEADGEWARYDVEDYAYARWKERQTAPLPASFVTATNLEPVAHLAMQAAVQPFVDNAISKTINVPTAMSFAKFRGIYAEAFALGLKGCTTFRPTAAMEPVLAEGGEVAGHCCTAEREAD
jgi:ribonucleoside-diphosphate reductase alpha chain